MSYKIKLLPLALLDLQESSKWYNDQKTGLGGIFLNEAKSRISYISTNPQHYQIVYKEIRQAPLKKFPFLIHYKVLEEFNEILILSITHGSRNPRIWKGRV